MYKMLLIAGIGLSGYAQNLDSLSWAPIISSERMAAWKADSVRRYTMPPTPVDSMKTPDYSWAWDLFLFWGKHL